MTYADFLNSELTIVEESDDSPLVYDLFSGCGGLALGFESMGFKTVGFDISEDSCITYSKNLHGECRQSFLTPGIDLGPKPDIIIGGPPCQPFSVRGHQNGNYDKRNGFPAFLSAVSRYQPKLVIFENVRGILYKNKEYFRYILNSLSNLQYIVTYKLLNAAHYGVPQSRERVFVIAHRGIWNFPERMYHLKPVTAGEAIRDLISTIPDNAKFLTPSMDQYIAKYEKKSKCIKPRDLHLDQPSRTLTCRNLYGATADMIRLCLPDGRRRQITIKEAARLQSFPDNFEFHGSESSQFEQIGNAVPPILAKAIAKSAIDCYNGLTFCKEEIVPIVSNTQARLPLLLSSSRNE
ncbi:MAG: DNA (cytosine-5-)-methyltransferase [Dehalococcoidales bacterium]|nr:DNA (cytosine-5-)-methyltransferase [Dehalococcoidales bacterium]